MTRHACYARHTRRSRGLIEKIVVYIIKIIMTSLRLTFWALAIIAAILYIGYCLYIGTASLIEQGVPIIDDLSTNMQTKISNVLDTTR